MMQGVAEPVATYNRWRELGRQVRKGTKAKAVLAPVLVGRDVIPGHWTFQIVEAYDSNYWLAFRAVEDATRRQLIDGVRHVHEADMKRDEQNRTRTPNSASPASTAGPAA